MPDVRWEIHGVEYGNCNCDYGCPCQFGWPKPSFGFCEALVCSHVERGFHADTPLDGLTFAFLARWPGAVHEGKGTQVLLIDERADRAQRRAIERILRGEDTEPGATHYFVYNSTMETIHGPEFVPIEFEADVEARRARVRIPGWVESEGTPIFAAADQKEHRVRIELPNGFEYRVAEIGAGTTRSRGPIELDLSRTYGQWNALHTSQSGVIG